ncbi:MAG: glycine dehydrogenase [candidate division Zixibacteria bacterium SM23_81]|nr:MAG: glycine dehydrogenase [candidate division Zixibacteria bacterium SM23_81]
MKREECHRVEQERLVFELSSPARRGTKPPKLDVPRQSLEELLPQEIRRADPPPLPQVSEADVVRHFTRLSVLNHHVDRGFYPLGSCTMKYNPKFHEGLARLPGLCDLHPLQPVETIQGALRLMHRLGRWLCELAGLDAITLQPAAGAHGELTGLLMIRALLQDRGSSRTKVIIPDSAHGTNPASARIAGYQVVQVPSNPQGQVDLTALRQVLDDQVAALMLTVPNTLGIFESQIQDIAQMVHDVGGLMYMDGANLNALLGIVRPGDMGFDVVHFNLHKTFSAPHGGGGPGAGPVGVKKELAPYLPVPVVVKSQDGSCTLEHDRAKTIGKVQAFYGNFGVMVKAYAYIRHLGLEGFRRVSENAIINANYLMRRLQSTFDLPHGQHCQHEFVLSGKKFQDQGVRTLDIAKRLLDFGVHAPTIYFPLIVPEALMIEPTETESLESLDAFVEAMIQIAQEAESDPEVLKTAPHCTPVARLDEVKAARDLKLRWQPED